MYLQIGTTCGYFCCPIGVGWEVSGSTLKFLLFMRFEAIDSLAFKSTRWIRWVGFFLISLILTFSIDQYSYDEYSIKNNQDYYNPSIPSDWKEVAESYCCHCYDSAPHWVGNVEILVIYEYLYYQIWKVYHSQSYLCRCSKSFPLIMYKRVS